MIYSTYENNTGDGSSCSSGSADNTQNRPLCSHYHDPASTIWEPVNGQGRDEYKDIEYGLSNFGKSGCGVIAVFNAMLLIGKQLSLRSVINYFSGPMTMRPFGVFPEEIGDYLDDFNVIYTQSYNSDIIENVKNGGVVIVTFWNSTSTVYTSYPHNLGGPIKTVVPNVFKGAHTVAITYRNGYYIVYNPSNQAEKPYKCQDIYNYIGEGFIYGYYIPQQ